MYSLEEKDVVEKSGEDKEKCSIKTATDILYQYELNEKIIRIACGGAHSIVITNKYKVYSWGRNENGQLGLGNLTSFYSSPCEVTALSKENIGNSFVY